MSHVPAPRPRRTLWLIGVIAAALLLLLAVLTPLLVASPEWVARAGEDAMTALPIIVAPFALIEAGGGPFANAARIAGGLVGLTIAAILCALVFVLLMAARPRFATASVVLCSIGIAGAVGATLLVTALAAQWDYRVLPVSPAALCLLAGSILGCITSVAQRAHHAQTAAAPT